MTTKTMKKLLSCVLIVPLGLAVVVMVGAFVGTKGFPVNLLVLLGEPITKALSSVFPGILSEAVLLKIDPHSAPMGYITLVMWVGFAFWVVAGWVLCAVVGYVKRKPPNSLLNTDAQKRRAG